MSEHPVLRERVHRRIPEDATSGQKGGIEDQEKRSKGQEEGREEGGLPFSIDEHQMARSQEHDPRHKGGVLHRIPGPKPAEAKRFIGPGSAHQDTGAQDPDAEESPRERGPKPSREIPTGKAGDRISEGDGSARKTEKEGRWMDRHPVIAEEGGKALSVLELGIFLQIIGVIGPGSVQVVGQFPDQDERVAPDLGAEEIDPEDHGEQKDLDHCHDTHDGSFPVLYREDEDVPQHDLPKAP